jgi:DNA-binding GntR family transcriptional regulator
VTALMAEMRRQTEAALAQGFRAVKIEVLFYDAVTDAELVGLVRDGQRWLGDGIALMLDFGYRWRHWRDAARVLERLDGLDIYFAEAALPHDDLEGHRRLAERARMRICGAEMAATRFEVREWIAAGGVDVVQPDISRAGGLTEMLRIADLCELAGVEVIPHGWKSGVLAHAGLHFQAASAATPTSNGPRPRSRAAVCAPNWSRPSRWCATASSRCPRQRASASTSTGARSGAIARIVRNETTMTGPAPSFALAAPNLALLPERVADRIAEAIAEGRIAGGVRLVEAKVALALGVTRTPLREAFRILQTRGLVQITPRRGARVIDFDADWADDVRNLRLGVEKVSCARAARRLRSDPAALVRLGGAIAAIRAAVAQGDLMATNRADLALHRLLADLAESPLVSALWQAIRRHVLILFSINVHLVPGPHPGAS